MYLTELLSVNSSVLIQCPLFTPRFAMSVFYPTLLCTNFGILLYKYLTTLQEAEDLGSVFQSSKPQPVLTTNQRKAILVAFTLKDWVKINFLPQSGRAVMESLGVRRIYVTSCQVIIHPKTWFFDIIVFVKDALDMLITLKFLLKSQCNVMFISKRWKNVGTK